MVVLATSTLMTHQKIEEELDQIPCIQYSVIFKKQIEALLDLRSKVNVMNQAFAY